MHITHIPRKMISYKVHQPSGVGKFLKCRCDASLGPKVAQSRTSGATTYIVS